MSRPYEKLHDRRAIVNRKALVSQFHALASGERDGTALRTQLLLGLKGALTDGRAEIRRHPARGAGPTRHFADIRRLRGLGFRPRFDLARSASDMVAYYLIQVAGAAEGARAPVDTAEGRQDRAGAGGSVRAWTAPGSAE